MPFSVLFAIIIMYFTGININVMSLAGLCLGIGMLVDNSIVVMENIYRFRNEGMSASKAAVRGTAQVAGPILASTITTICVFLPMVYTSGMVSQLFNAVCIYHFLCINCFFISGTYCCADNGFCAS
ncbi:MAG: efflux RND transporter permease subunit [Anaerobutyricum hallii]